MSYTFANREGVFFGTPIIVEAGITKIPFTITRKYVDYEEGYGPTEYWTTGEGYALVRGTVPNLEELIEELYMPYQRIVYLITPSRNALLVREYNVPEPTARATGLAIELNEVPIDVKALLSYLYGGPEWARENLLSQLRPEEKEALNLISQILQMLPNYLYIQAFAKSIEPYLELEENLYDIESLARQLLERRNVLEDLLKNWVLLLYLYPK